MSTEEFYNEFNLAYNNLSSNQAAGLNHYEISVYLTKAQKALVETAYGNFEKSEEYRRILANLVKTKQCSPIQVPSSSISYPEYTTCFTLPNEVKYIVNERIKMGTNADRCIRGKYIEVQPVSHDEVERLIKNPFRFTLKRAFRLDTSGSNVTIEILSKDSHVDLYIVRYIMIPEPIIIEDFSNTTDYVDGKQRLSTGSLLPEFHRKVVELAAKLAYEDYKQ